jgi:hypothetical protein
VFTQFKIDLVNEVLKSAPPLAVVGTAWYLKLELDDWLKLATIGYIALQAVYLLWRWYQDWKKTKPRKVRK